MTIKWKTIQINGIDWTYSITGKARDTLVIFPGGMRRPMEESAFIDELAKKFRIISPVYPRISSMKKLAEGMAVILDQEKVKAAHIYGSSFGGIMSQAFAVYYPKRVKKMIIGNTGTRSDDPAFSKKVKKGLRLLRILPAFLVRNIVLKSFTRVVPMDFSDREKIAGAIKQLVESRKLDKPDILCHFESLLDFKENVNLTPETAADFQKKLLIITATGDKGVSPDSIAALHAMYPKAKYFHFEQGGHMPMLVFPEQYIKLMTDFLG